ncbi:ParB/RepB/Spo0J family partition protein [Melioribacter sp. OK-6-Me]|uniref:ParB/RepB/Spo0J family partition protein n=1 Tax=unclassified Melioribacter TaxID=2627329 RepID=UPI003EDAA9F8
MKSALGRGLDALINPQLKDKLDAPVTVSSKDIPKDDGKSYDILAKISVSQIYPNPYQPRTNFEPQALEELKLSILQNGLIQPVTVRRIDKDKYELISGERRLRACKEIGLKEIPAYIIKVDTKEAMLALSLIENIQREKLNPIEIAVAYKRLRDECNLSHEEIAERVGKDRTTITNFIRLLKLPESIQQSLINNKISTGHARALINLSNPKLQLQIHDKILKQNLSVRKVEDLVRKLNDPKSHTTPKDNSNTSFTTESASQRNIEERLQRILGTKVHCNVKKNGAGQIVIEFYSNDELERLFELFEIINSNYN